MQNMHHKGSIAENPLHVINNIVSMEHFDVLHHVFDVLNHVLMSSIIYLKYLIMDLKYSVLNHIIFRGSNSLESILNLSASELS